MGSVFNCICLKCGYSAEDLHYGIGKAKKDTGRHIVLNRVTKLVESVSFPIRNEAENKISQFSKMSHLEAFRQIYDYEKTKYGIYFTETNLGPSIGLIYKILVKLGIKNSNHQLLNGRFFCPKCNKYKLKFSETAHWD